MADLVETSVFPEGVYQIETSDPVIGGVPNVGTGAGMSNIPHLLLANRTRFLKNAVDNIVAGLTNFVTRPQFESSQRPATTEFVRREIGNLRGQTSVNASLALTADHTGQRILISGTATLTLPLLSTVPPGTAFLMVAQTGITGTIQASGADSIFIAGELTGSFTLSNRSVVFIVAGNTNWNVDLGDHALTRSPLFGCSLGAAGYQRLPSGLIMQWGAGAAPASGTVTVTFPIAFPTACRSLAFAEQNIGPTAANSQIIGYDTLTAANFTASAWRHDGVQATSNFQYIAIGH